MAARPGGSPEMAVPMSAPAFAAGVRVQRVIDVDPIGDPRWRQLVMSHPDATIYHHPAWLEAIQREYGRPLIGLGCEDAARRLVGVLPLMPTRGLPLGGNIAGRRLASLPRTPIAGPLAVDEEACATLVRAAVARVEAEPGVQLQLKIAAPLPSAAAAMVHCRPWRETYALDLTATSAAATNAGARRNNAWAASKARRSGVIVRLADAEAELRSWYRLYLGTMRGLAVPARPYRMFLALWQRLRPAGMMRLVLAERQIDGRATLLAGSIFFSFGSTISYAFSGWGRKSHALRANDLIHAEMIEAARRAGYRSYDFGEVAGGQQSLAAFKGKWGAQARRLYHVVYPARVDAQESGLGSGRLHGVAASLWRRMPLEGTAALGDLVYRFL